MKEQLYIRDLLLDLFRKAKTEQEKITLLNIFGSFAAKNFISEFRFKALEAFFREFSKKHFSQRAEMIGGQDENCMVHLITRTYETGGHSRFLENLIELDRKRTHHLIVMDQNGIPKRESLEFKVRQQGGQVIHLQDLDLINKGLEIIDFLIKNPGRILLHHHPEDLLPSLILPSLKNKLELILFNHADHAFSFGFEIVDKVINIREEAHRMTVHWRKVENSFVLPLPILKPALASDQITEIRRKYQLEEHQQLGLCIGSPYKFQKTASHYFFGTIHQALEQNPHLVVMIVGLDEQSAKRHSVDYLPHPRLRLMGIVPDPTELQMIASLAIDPMPYGSYTALLETCFYGALPLVCYNTLPLFNLYDDQSFTSDFRISKNEKEYLVQVKELLALCNDQKKKEVALNIQKYHGEPEWLSNFEQLLVGERPKDPCPPPQPIHKLESLNQELEQLRFRLLVDLYENCKYLSRANVFRAIIRLSLGSYNKRELAGILKKRFTKDNR
jgi:hypothetical protein